MATSGYDSDASSVYSSDFAPEEREARRAARDVDHNREFCPLSFLSPCWQTNTFLRVKRESMLSVLVSLVLRCYWMGI
jgi:hypothetical protein